MNEYSECREGTTGRLNATVLEFLATNGDRAFKAREIASQIGVDEGAVSTALSRLKDRDLVEHKATHWAVTDDEECLEGYSGYERATALFNERLDEEDTEAWREHARLDALQLLLTVVETSASERSVHRNTVYDPAKVRK